MGAKTCYLGYSFISLGRKRDTLSVMALRRWRGAMPLLRKFAPIQQDPEIACGSTKTMHVPDSQRPGFRGLCRWGDKIYQGVKQFVRRDVQLLQNLSGCGVCFNLVFARITEIRVCQNTSISAQEQGYRWTTGCPRVTGAADLSH